MNMTLVIILLVAIFSIFFYSACFLIVRKSNNEKYIREHSISFKESMDLIKAPVITCSIEGINVNFLLDTGSNISYIDSSVINSLNKKNIDTPYISGRIEITSLGGKTVLNSQKIISIQYKDISLKGNFYITELSELFDSSSIGINIGGILGSDFFNTYKYTIDFRKLVAYNNTRK